MAGNDTCAHVMYKVAPFMNTPASATDMDQLMHPVWWMMQGRGYGQYDMSTYKPQLVHHLKTYSVHPVAGLGAMFALLILSLVIFLLWRFCRCICVVCCQQEAYADAVKVLGSTRLRVCKAFLVVLGLAGCGMATWGMASLDNNFPATISQEIDTLQAFPAKLVQQVNLLANQTENIIVPLADFDAILTKVNIPGMRADVQHVDTFFQNAPTPAQLKSVMQALQGALNPTFIGVLGQLQAQINDSSSSPLHQLKQHVNVLAAFDINTIKDATNADDIAIKAVLGSAPGNESSFIATLQLKHADMNINGWINDIIAPARTAAAAINGMRNDITKNPFSLIQAAITDVRDTVTDVKDDKLAMLLKTVTKFNGLWYRNASDAFQGLLDKATYANKTVLVLPDDILQLVNKLNASLVDIIQLYEGPNSISHLPENITAYSDGLALPDTSGLEGQLGALASALNSTTSFQDLMDNLDTLTQTLQNNLQPAVTDIGYALGNYTASGDYNNDLKPVLDQQAPTVHAVAQGLGGANFDTSAASGLASNLSSSDTGLQEQALAIDSVKQQLTALDFSSFTTALDQADMAYKAIGDPTTLTVPVIELLDHISALTTTQLDQAKSMVMNVSSTIKGVALQIQSAVVDRADGLQTKYLTANSTDTKSATPVNVMHWAYYGLLGAYAVVLLLLLLLFVVTLRNCPAGVCMIGCLLNAVLIIFALLPVIYTIVLLLMRDTCANVESLAITAVQLKTGNGSTPSMMASYYLNGGHGPDGSPMNVTDLVKSINADYDVDVLESKVNATVSNLLGTISQQFTLRPRVQDILGDVVTRVATVMGSVDKAITLLDYASVHSVYIQLKGWVCCDLADQLFVQWACCLVLVAMAWLALQCALLVLKNLDGLSESCCASSCYRLRDYRAEVPSGLKPLAGSDSIGLDATVAVISIGGASHTAKGSKKYELPDFIPSAPALPVMQSLPTTPVLPSRMYPTILAPAPNGGAPPYAPTDLQAARASLFSGAMYPGEGDAAAARGYYPGSGV